MIERTRMAGSLALLAAMGPGHYFTPAPWHIPEHLRRELAPERPLHRSLYPALPYFTGSWEREAMGFARWTFAPEWLFHEPLNHWYNVWHYGPAEMPAGHWPVRRSSMSLPFHQ